VAGFLYDVATGNPFIQPWRGLMHLDQMMMSDTQPATPMMMQNLLLLMLAVRTFSGI
jgi:hypothetical protein